MSFFKIFQKSNDSAWAGLVKIGHELRDSSSGRSVHADAKMSAFVDKNFDRLKDESKWLNANQLSWVRSEVEWLRSNLANGGTVGKIEDLIQDLSLVEPDENGSVDQPASQKASAKLDKVMLGAIKEGLQKWVKDSSTGGNKVEAANRIYAAFQNRDSSLSLADLQLSSLPEELGLLVSLQELSLSYNMLESLPPEIGGLVRLQKLYLSFNHLVNLPEELGQLRCLEVLSAGNNQIEELPESFGNLQLLDELWLNSNKIKEVGSCIGGLSHLRKLRLDSNQLNSLPRQLGNLYELRDLNLANNQLEALPVEIGSLTRLSKLSFKNNQALSHLPLTLGDLAEITHLTNQGTAIPKTDIEAVLDSCRMQREATALHELPRHLNHWQQIARSHDWKGESLDDLLEQLQDDEKITLNDWFIRLSKAKEFERQPGELAALACNILSSVRDSSDFREQFLNHARVNNESCEDRAAMAFNEIYTSWLLENIDQEVPLEERLNLLVGLSKTLALREVLQYQLAHHQGDLGESVEIFLYYETKLQEDLQLVTAVKSMAHSQIGERNWIEVDQLKQEVTERFLEVLVDLPACIALIESAEDYIAPKPTDKHNEPDQEEIYGELDRLQNQLDLKIISEGEYLVQAKHLQRTWEQVPNSESSHREARMRWLKQHVVA